ncbi:peptidoglycan-binding domain-containing protein [Longispora albida]|uniref:peptidoglycan-binding domain-containing protein n=1 Tax=Longispora albida TaxID=203523 RepID=UPI00039FBF6B|nr:peptidoglycan-binding domain-containing protein [Longispora albida]
MLAFARNWENAIASAEFSGIVGDRAHARTGGYHISREDQPGWNYSVQLPEDKRGASNWASAVDMSMNAADMRLVTSRLLASAKDPHDPRLDPVREFFGTLDGRTVTGWDCYHGRPSSSDTSHLWHVHVSFLRQHADNAAALAAVLDVILGKPATGAPPTPTPQPQPSYPAWPGRHLSYTPGRATMNGQDVRTWQQRMSARGWSIGVDGWYGPQSASVCRAFQSEKSLGVDGIVGPITWAAAWTAPVT